MHAVMTRRPFELMTVPPNEQPSGDDTAHSSSLHQFRTTVIGHVSACASLPGIRNCCPSARTAYPSTRLGPPPAVNNGCGMPAENVASVFTFTDIMLESGETKNNSFP